MAVETPSPVEEPHEGMDKAGGGPFVSFTNWWRAGSKPPLGPARRGVRELGLGLITAGVILLLFLGYELLGTNFSESGSQHRLANQFNSAVSANHGHNPDSSVVGATPGSGPPPGGAIDHIVIPRMGLNKYVVQGVTDAQLSQGPGHYPQTVMPGQLGNAGIAGHRTTYGAPFYELDKLVPGDPIVITDNNGRTFTYIVTGSRVVSPTDTTVLNNTPTATLTLTTCNPRFSATSRLIVSANLQGSSLPAPAGISHNGNAFPDQAAGAHTLTAGDAGEWPAVILLGAAVLLGWVLVRLVINRTRRGKRAAAYVIGIAVLLVPLWFLCGAVVRLLPSTT